MHLAVSEGLRVSMKLANSSRFSAAISSLKVSSAGVKSVILVPLEFV
jgi:hypothetical protein